MLFVGWRSILGVIISTWDISILDISILDISILDISILDISILDISILDISILGSSPMSRAGRELPAFLLTSLSRDKLAPFDWYEYYSNERVQAWIGRWLLHCSESGLGYWDPPQQNLKIPGSYVVDSKLTKTGGAIVDFAWLPVRRTDKSPIVLLEIDENYHRSYRWDEERYRELFIFKQLLTQRYPQCPRITLIRFNPHEYPVDEREYLKAKSQREAEKLRETTRRTRSAGSPVPAGEPVPAKDLEADADLIPLMKGVTRLPLRHERLKRLKDLIQLGLQNNRDIQDFSRGWLHGKKIMVVFAYYPRWYWDIKPSTLEPFFCIHLHTYADCKAFQQDVDRGAGKHVRLDQRRTFLKPTFWTYTDTPSQEARDILKQQDIVKVCVCVCVCTSQPLTAVCIYRS